MAGFQLDSLNRHLKTLTENKYIVQIVDETKEHGIITRNISRTVNNTTLTDDITTDTKWIFYIIVLGKEMSIAGINLQLGETIIYPDQTYKEESIYEVLSKYSIGEIVVHTTEKINLSKPCIYINTDSRLKISYKEEFLQKIYTKTIGLSIIENLGMEMLELGSNCFVHLLNYTLKYDPSLIRKISKPQIIYQNEILHLSENAINQLDIPNVLKEINHTNTPMGYRLLTKKIYNPLIKDIKYEVSTISPDLLKNIGDIDKIWTRFVSLRANKNDIIKVYNSLQNIQILFRETSVSENTLNDFSKKSRGNLKEVLLKNMEKILKFILKRIHIDTTVDELFKNGYSTDIDEIIKEKKHKLEEIENVRKEIHPELVLNIVRDKLYYSCSNNVKKMITSKITASKTNKGWRISNTTSDILFEEYIDIQEKYETLLQKYLIIFCKELTEKYTEFFHKVSKKVAEIDVAVCCQTLINKYGYNIPNIREENGCLEYKGLVHPISKNINTGFIPQNVSLNGGMLLYGVNFSGKSTLLRSVGIAVILAQAGLPCPVEKMEFTPFTRIYTKISLGDNYLKGQSTFTNEIYEMKKMVDNSDERSLILADELCSGTEIYSAVALVASSILSISKKGSKFIFTTHYHALADMEEIKNTNTEIYHMSVEQSREGVFEFSRKLLKGKCGDIYGIEIAVHMDMNSEFIMNANKIRSKLVNGDILTNKTSRYNSDVYVSECKLCGSKEDLHTHHIKFQKDFEEEDIRKHYKGNLIVLCEKCHQRVHKDEINISGYIETTNGIKIV